MSWGVDVYLELRQQREIMPTERGAMPMPEDVAVALDLRAAAIERSAPTINAAWTANEPLELRQRAREVRDGTPVGRDIFRAELLHLIEVKRGNRPPYATTRYLPPDVLKPFNTEHRDALGGHTSRFLDELAETQELTNPSLRR